MRILHVTPHYRPAWRYGGPIRSVHGLAAAQAAAEHEVHVYTTDADGSDRLNVPEQAVIDGVHVHYFRLGAGRRLYRAPKMARALRRHVAGFDVIHTHSAWVWPTLAAARAARRAGVPLVYAPRGMLVTSLVAGRSAAVKRAWLALFERHHVAQAAIVHVTTPAEGRQLAELDLHPPRVRVVSNGVEPPPVPAGPVDAPWLDAPFLLFLGRVSWEKGVDRLLTALAAAPGVRLVIAGPVAPDYRARLDAAAAKLGLGARLVMVGPIEGDVKGAALRAARALVLPSLSENFGVAAAEAMALGTPVVVTPEVGLAEAVAASGAGWVADDAALPAALTTAFAGTERATRGAAGAAYAARHFAWPAIAAAMTNVYAEAIAHAPRASRRTRT